MIVYHHNDMDGKTAGWLVHTMKPAAIEDHPSDYIMMDYNSKFDKHTAKDDVFVVDFSISHSTYDQLIELCKTVDFSKIIEFTIEVNPEDLTKEIIDLFVTYNINRVSIGIQTLDEELLKKINRSFDYKRFLENYHYLKQAIPNINFDVMYAVPSQSVEMLSK